MEKTSLFFNGIIRFTNMYLKQEFLLKNVELVENNKERISACINVITEQRIFIIFNFDIDLCEYLFEKSTDGLEIEEDEIEEFMEETVSNFINIVIGRVLPKLETQKKVSLSIPLVLHDNSKKTVDNRFTTFHKTIPTNKGNLNIMIFSSDVNLVPRDVFAMSLKAKPKVNS